MTGQRPPTHIVADLLARTLDHRPGWEHPAMLTLIADLTPEQALWRPAPGRRCVWELVEHVQHWRRFTAERLAGERTSPGEPWPAPPSTGDRAELARAWRALLDDVRRTHQRLVEGARTLDLRAPHPHPDMADQPLWVSAVIMQMHDSYHLGQIALLRGLQGLEPVD